MFIYRLLKITDKVLLLLWNPVFTISDLAVQMNHLTVSSLLRKEEEEVRAPHCRGRLAVNTRDLLSLWSDVESEREMMI